MLTLRSSEAQDRPNDGPPDLLTFGVLTLPTVPFRREKPLLLLAYLSLRGPQDRRAVAHLFWPDATDPMNSLSVALGQLRRASEALLHVADTQLMTALTCDVPDLLRACGAGNLSAAQGDHRGAADLSDDLAEWVTVTREGCANAYRTLLLEQARRAANTDPGSAPPGPALYCGRHVLLSAAGGRGRRAGHGQQPEHRVWRAAESDEWQSPSHERHAPGDHGQGVHA